MIFAWAFLNCCRWKAFVRSAALASDFWNYTQMSTDTHKVLIVFTGKIRNLNKIYVCNNEKRFDEIGLDEFNALTIKRDSRYFSQLPRNKRQQIKCMSRNSNWRVNLSIISIRFVFELLRTILTAPSVCQVETNKLKLL